MLTELRAYFAWQMGGRIMNLSVSTLFFELALIFMPGFIWMKIQKSYGARGEVTQFYLILNAFIFGVVGIRNSWLHLLGNGRQTAHPRVEIKQ